MSWNSIIQLIGSTHAIPHLLVWKSSWFLEIGTSWNHETNMRHLFSEHFCGISSTWSGSKQFVGYIFRISECRRSKMEILATIIGNKVPKMSILYFFQIFLEHIWVCSGATEDHLHQILRLGDYVPGCYTGKRLVPRCKSSHKKVEPKWDMIHLFFEIFGRLQMVVNSL